MVLHTLLSLGIGSISSNSGPFKQRGCGVGTAKEAREGGREGGRTRGLAFFYKKLPSGIKKLKTSMLFQFLFCLML